MDKKNENPSMPQRRNDETGDDLNKPVQGESSAGDQEKDLDDLVHEGKLSETDRENDEFDADEAVHNRKPLREKNEGERDIDDLMHR